MSEKLDHYLSGLATKPSAPRAGGIQSVEDSKRPLSVGEFVKAINPEKKNEIAATLGYFLEFYAEPVLEDWKPEEIGNKFTDVRKPKPANVTDLLKKSEFFMAGKEKGSYRLSGTGVKWIEERMTNAQ